MPAIRPNRKLRVAGVIWNPAQLWAVLVQIETVGAARMEAGSSNGQEARRLYNDGRFRVEKGEPC